MHDTQLFENAIILGATSKYIDGHKTLEADGMLPHQDIVETYFPLRKLPSGQILGIIGLRFQPARNLLLQVADAKSTVLSTTVVTMSGLFAFLLAFILLANIKINKSNKRELMLVEESNRVWEIEVRERTQAYERLIDEISERRRMEEELRAAAANLKRSNSELEQFASIASHDLQEPLRKIRTFGDRLLEGAGDQLGEKHQDYLGQLLNAAQRMQPLINDLLSYSRVTTNASPFVAVDLNVIVQGVLSDLEIAIEEATALVEVEPLPAINADPTQIRQLLQNLVSNSLKFRKEAQPPIVKIRSRILVRSYDNSGFAKNGSEAIELTVEDNGIGFDEAYIERIFGVFQRLHSRREFPGTGIGLAVRRKIADRHHGNLTAKSSLGNGATFIVTLPVEHQTDQDNLEIFAGDNQWSKAITPF